MQFSALPAGGAPVVLLHGMAASRRDWDHLAPVLHANGHSVYALDLLGHGESPKPEQIDAYHIETLYRALEAWLFRLKLEQPAVLVGHSMGGYLSLLYALRNREKVRALALVDPLYSPAQISPLLFWMKPWPQIGVRAVRVAPEWLVNAVSGITPTFDGSLGSPARQQMLADYKRAAPQIFYIPRTLRDLTPLLPRVAQPTLVVWGGKDRTLQPASFERMVGLLPAGRGECLPGVGHQPHLSEPERFKDLLVGFLEQQDAARGSEQ